MSSCKSCIVKALGPCDDFCASERLPLEERARAAAQANGHQPGHFAKAADGAVWEARCTLCGSSIHIGLDPEPGQPEVWGPAAVQPCSAPSA